MTTQSPAGPLVRGGDPERAGQDAPEQPVRFLLTGEETDGQIALVETILGKRDAPPALGTPGRSCS